MLLLSGNKLPMPKGKNPALHSKIFIRSYLMPSIFMHPTKISSPKNNFSQVLIAVSSPIIPKTPLLFKEN